MTILTTPIFSLATIAILFSERQSSCPTHFSQMVDFNEKVVAWLKYLIKTKG